ncbi:MAG: hypothetical protein C0497_16220 [Gemmatimonas sp.]|nr:hypothetical protein [Gemmatimonas sp.]
MTFIKNAALAAALVALSSTKAQAQEMHKERGTMAKFDSTKYMSVLFEMNQLRLNHSKRAWTWIADIYASASRGVPRSGHGELICLSCQRVGERE